MKAGMHMRSSNITFNNVDINDNYGIGLYTSSNVIGDLNIYNNHGAGIFTYGQDVIIKHV